MVASNELSHPAVSVVMPFFNSQLYVSDAMESVLGQTLTDIEVICVDNGSTDSSCDIVRGFQKRDGRVKLLYSEGTAGDARNVGLDAAVGDYIVFLDSDDLFRPKMLEAAYCEISTHDADVVLYGGERFDETADWASERLDFLEIQYLPDKSVFSYRDIPDRIFQVTTPAPWARMYRRDFVVNSGIRFQSLRNSNDWYFTFATMASAQRICALKESLIRYRINVSSSLQAGKEKNPLCCFKAVYDLADRLYELGIMDAVWRSYARQSLSTISFVLGELKKSKSRYLMFEEMESDRFQSLSLLGHECSVYGEEYTYRIAVYLENALSLYDKLTNPCRFDNFRKISIATPFENPKVSIIVPVFNTSDYVEEAINSIMNQTFDEVEVICIDDGSDDDSLGKLERIASKDSRISVYAQENSGLSRTRNNGLSVARGEYVLFLDSDDSLGLNAISELYQRAKLDDLDILLFDASPFAKDREMSDACRVYSDYYSRSREYGAVLSGAALMAQMCQNGDYLPSACIYILKRSYAQDKQLSFPEGILHEDNAFTFSALLQARRASHVHKAFYNRLVRIGSITSSEKDFFNVYGYYVCYKRMFRTLLSMHDNISSDEFTYAQAIVADCLSYAQEDYYDTSYWQHLVRLALPDPDLALFESMFETELFRKVMNEIDNRGERIVGLQNAVGDIQRSFSYRAGKVITLPFRKVYRAVRGTKEQI